MEDRIILAGVEARTLYAVVLVVPMILIMRETSKKHHESWKNLLGWTTNIVEICFRNARKPTSA